MQTKEICFDKKNSGRQPSSENPGVQGNRPTKFPRQGCAPIQGQVLWSTQKSHPEAECGPRRHPQPKKAKRVGATRSHSIKSRRGEIAKLKPKRPVTPGVNIVSVCTLIPYERDGAIPRKEHSAFYRQKRSPLPADDPKDPQRRKVKRSNIKNLPDSTEKGRRD